jgi:hypothetical protein
MWPSIRIVRGAEAVEIHLVETQALVLRMNPLAARPFLAALGRNRDHLAQECDDVV